MTPFPDLESVARSAGAYDEPFPEPGVRTAMERVRRVLERYRHPSDTARGLALELTLALIAVVCLVAVLSRMGWGG